MDGPVVKAAQIALSNGDVNRVLNWVGTRSYGLYLFHWPIYQMIRKQAGIALTVPKFVLAMVIAVAVAEASFRYLETPVRKREFFGRFAGGGSRVMLGLGAAGLLIGYAGVSLGTADVKCTSKIECASVAATSTTVSTAITLPPDPTASSTAQTSVATLPGETTTVVPPTILTKPVIDTLALGESVMQGALSALTGAGVNVDAQESLQAKGMIAKLQADLATYDVTNAVVIQVGTNGPVTAAQYDELATIVANVPKVFFMTVKAPKDWIAPNNAIIAALPSKYPNVQVIDWATAGAQIEGELSSSDGGIHLNSGTAIRYYSNLILGALGKAQIPNP